MPASLPRIVRHLRRVVDPPADTPDADLLARFTRHRDEAAFAALVHRHGPAVLAVCRRHAGHAQDAEDACQATFLLLARKAAGLTARASVAGWLCAAARNVARKARRAAARRAARESRATPAPRPDPDPGLADLCAVLDAEVARLPPSEREVFTVCVLGGLSKAQAARRLGWTEGTVSGRLARARERLRARLARRGVSLSAALTALALAGPADALAPPLVAAAVRRACEPAGHGAVIGLTRSVGATILVGAALTAGGAAWLLQPPQGAGQPKPPAADPPAPKEVVAVPRTDFVGDPLPDRALARIGHQRFRHEDMVWLVAVSPDGKTVASATRWGVVRLWEADTGKVLRSWDAQTEEPPTDLRFLGRGDRLFVGLTGKALPSHIADVATGKVVWKHTADVDPVRKKWGNPSVHLSPDGGVLLESWGDGMVRAFDRATGTIRFERKVAEAGLGRGYRKLHFLADGKGFLMAPGPGAGVWACSSATGDVIRKYDLSFASPLLSVSADGRYLAAFESGNGHDADAKNTVVVWDLRKNEKVCRVVQRFPDLFCLEFSPDGKTFAVGRTAPGADVVLLNTADGSEVRRFPVGAYCLCLAFAPDGRSVVTGDNRGLLTRWDVATGKKLPPVAADVPETLYRAEFVAGGRELLTYGTPIAWWDADTGKPLRTVTDSPVPHEARVSPDGKVIAFYRHDEKAEKKHTIRVRDLATGRDRVLFDKLDGHVLYPRFSPDGTRLAIPNQFTPKVYVLDVATGALVHELKDHKTYLDHAEFSPDGRRIVSYGADASADGDHEIRVWDADTGKLLHKLPPVRGSAFQVAFTPDGRQLVSVGGDPGRPNTKGEIHIWDLETGKLVRVWDGHTERVTCVAVSPDGRSAVTGSLDRTLRLWDVATGRLRHEFPGHRAYVTSVAFSRDGLRFVACSGDAPGYVWDVYGHLTGKPGPLSAEAARAAWADLAAPDAAAGFRAVCRLAAAGDGAVALLRGRLKPVAPVEQAKVERWVADLGAARFAAREQAAAELAKVADQVRPRLRKVLETETAAEVRDRVTKLLEAAAADGPEYRRGRRACEALEVIGTADARRLAAELAGGAPGARLTGEARATLERLDRRP